MQMKDLKYWKKRVERLDALNQFSREKLSILKKEKKRTPKDPTLSRRPVPFNPGCSHLDTRGKDR